MASTITAVAAVLLTAGAMIHAISRERQVILFSQEADVLAWAEANLEGPQDTSNTWRPLPPMRPVFRHLLASSYGRRP